MAWMIGIDEAGYGPNLGPLVVGATAWLERSGGGGRGAGARGFGSREGQTLLAPTATSSGAAVDLYARLAEVVASRPGDDRLAIADSKQLFKPGSGLRLLERGALGALSSLRFEREETSIRWQELFDTADPEGLRHELPWYVDFDCELPIDSGREELSALAARFRAGCAAVEVELVDVRARVVYPREFNDLTDYHGTKGAALSHISIALLKQVLEDLSPCPATPVPFSVTCDKHGGRNRYAALLQHHFPEHWIETLQESRPVSRYQWGPPERRVEVAFRAKGESELPTALASMTAKYHRELAMRAFNAYWGQQVPGVRPTAGYPVDAKRFKAEIQKRQRELDVDDRDLWRNR